MSTLGITHSVCNTCRQLVPAKVVVRGDDIAFQKLCPQHGQTENLVRRDVADYLRCLRCVKPAWTPREFAGDSTRPCPQGCGTCDRHEQHLCMPIIEITSRCDLACPVCLVDAGRPWDMTLDELRRVLDALVRAEGQVDILNLSGGEPLIHPEILAFVDEAMRRPEIIRVSVSTNGMPLLSDARLLHQLAERNVCISLQFDGFDDRAYRVLRGRPLLKQKLEILALLAAEDTPTSLTMTAAGGVNDDQFPRILDYYFSQPHIVSMMIQPVAFAGRAADLAGRARRLTIPDVIRLLGEAGDPRVSKSDFAPLPCSHGLCFSLAYYLMLDGGGTISVNSVVKASEMMDLLTNRTIFGLNSEDHESLKNLIYDLWSGPAGVAPDSKAVMKTLRSIFDEMCCSGFDARQAFVIAERRIKSIFIHAFQDAETFDLARARRCCNAYPQPDGKLIPACVRNVFRRQPWANPTANIASS